MKLLNLKKADGVGHFEGTGYETREGSTMGELGDGKLSRWNRKDLSGRKAIMEYRGGDNVGGREAKKINLVWKWHDET